MKKSDLKTGYIVTTRSGREYVVYLDVDTSYTDDKDVLVCANTYNWYTLRNFNEDLTHKFDSISDIMKVEKPYHPYCFQNMGYENCKRELLWERDSVKEMTVADVEKLVGCAVKIVKES